MNASPTGILLSLSDPSHLLFFLVSTEPSFTAHFPGEYGAQALTNLSSWTSSLFERTMLAMREKTQKACLLPSGQVNTVDPACKEALLHSKMVEPRNFEKYNLFDPFVNCPNDEPLRRMGGDPNVMNNDGGKWLCMDILEPPCTIFSIGSNGDFTFEESMLNATECAVYTFDCTFAGASIHPRHQYIQRCLGSAEKAEKDAWFLTLQVAAAQLGVEKINLLKIDIEGYEYDALSVWSQADLALPEQVAIEIHHSEVLYYGTSYHKTDEFSNLLCEFAACGLIFFFGSSFFKHSIYNMVYIKPLYTTLSL